eukprot:Partr_v1_DN28399_c1_g1_i1_m79624 putative Protein arginine n-methyltransferase
MHEEIASSNSNARIGLEFPAKKLKSLLVDSEAVDSKDQLTEEERWSVVMEYTVASNCEFLIVPLIDHNNNNSQSSEWDDSMFMIRDGVYAHCIVPEIQLGKCRGDRRVFVDRLLSWVNHLGFHAVILNVDKSLDIMTDDDSLDMDGFYWIMECVELACATLKWTQIWLDISCDQYAVWRALKASLGSRRTPSLHVSLSLSRDQFLSDDMRRWMGEPVSCIRLMRDCWLLNAEKWPVLPRKSHECLLRVVKSSSSISLVVPAGGHSKDLTAFSDYIQNLLHPAGSSPSVLERFASGYEDVLQMPLEPLRDNLDSRTYDTFMQDPVKYRLYEDATRKWIHRLLTAVPDGDCLNILVAGCGGKGPLVDAAIRAIGELGVHACTRLYALEKNPNALLTLRRHCKSSPLWQSYGEKSGHCIEIIESDMRAFRPDFDIDIVISELLGSFGDNELSPECLDSLMPWLRKDRGVSIPMYSTSYVAPLCSDALDRKVSANSLRLGDDAWHVPYVVNMKQACADIAPSQPVWTFEHNRDSSHNGDNTRVAHLEFSLDSLGCDTMDIHGFAGYFEAGLFEEGVCCSINPRTHSPEMISWFPIYFPLASPLSVNRGDTLMATFRRCVDPAKVWYEWSAAVKRNHLLVEFSTPMNLNARGSSVSLT